MKTCDIVDKINAINPNNNYLVFYDEQDNCYFGKDQNDNIVYMLESNSPNVPAVCQETKSLRFIFNDKCIFVCDGTSYKKTMHIMMCKDKDIDRIKAFIQLSKSFAIKETGLDQYYLSKLFASISALFDKKRNVPEIEKQGLFAELYTILFLYHKGCNIALSWQSRDKMKFDFSLNSKKRVEVKSTTKPMRVHHFKHDQLRSELYDIKIVSVMLQKNDCGVSLKDLIDEITELFQDEFSLMLHIENTISHMNKDELLELKYDETYIKNHFKIFDSKNIPHFNEKSPEGVFNAEYDCDMETAKELPIEEFISWIDSD